MTPARTQSILQRVPVILAVTAASYGLAAQSRAARAGADAGRTSRPQGPSIRARTPRAAVASHH